MLCGGLSSHTVIDLSSTNPCGQTHLRGNRGVKKQEVSRDTDTEKIETDVQGDNYSKISWDLFARTLF